MILSRVHNIRHTLGAFLALLLFLVYAPPTHALGVGWCHWFGGLSSEDVKNITPGGEIAWSQVEKTEGQYDFSKIESMVQKARAAGKKLHIHFMVSNPSVDSDNFVTVPDWAIAKGMHVTRNSKGQVIMPIQWDPLYMEYHEKLIKAFAQKFEKPEYYDVIEAVIMPSGGNWGEMALPVVNGAEKGDQADALDPNNLFVKELARVFLGSEDRSVEIARKEGGRWVADDYYIKAVENIIDLYARSLSHYPFSLQLGFGLTYQHRVAQEPVEYGLSKYGSRMWIRAAWWGSFGAGDSSPDAQEFWGRYQDKTVLVYEGGHPSWWCAAEGGYQKGGCYDCCQWDTRAQADAHNNNFINMAINSGTVATCMQSVFFEHQDKYNINWDDLNARLLDNAKKKAHLLNVNVPSPPPLPTHTPIPTATPTTEQSHTPMPTQLQTTIFPTATIPMATEITSTSTPQPTDAPEDQQLTFIGIPKSKGEEWLGSITVCKRNTVIMQFATAVLDSPQKTIGLLQSLDRTLETTVDAFVSNLYK